MASIYGAYLKAIGVKPMVESTGKASSEAAPVKRTSIYKTYLETVISKPSSESKIMERKVEAAKVEPVVEAVKAETQVADVKPEYRCKYCGGVNHI